MNSTNDVRVTGYQALPSPRQFRADRPLSAQQEQTVSRGRSEAQAILNGTDDRLLVVVGPCSVHDTEAALDYARRLAALADTHRDTLSIVMRVYFEKPRSNGGWKGLINDPHLDGSHQVVEGLTMARTLLTQILELGLPVGCEFLEPTSPQFFADAVSWGAIGARTTESQIHRQLASGLSMPIGFKNATDGGVQVAIDGCRVAEQAQVFFGVDDDGAGAIVATAGNPDGHVILRGGHAGPNCGTDDIQAAVSLLTKARRQPRLIVDASHANSGKDHVRQAQVTRELAAQVAAGEPIAGIMMESFIEAGSQKLIEGRADELAYGQSVTDACLGWDQTAELLGELAQAVEANRAVDRTLPVELLAG